MSDIKLVKGAEGIDTDKQECKAEGKKRFRVALVSMAAEVRTIYAADGQEAIALCTQKKMGLHAGRQGPTVISVAASSFEDSPHSPDFIKLTMDQLMSVGAQPQPMIEKPKIILPPGFDPKGPRGA